jgi:hypothetical protein
LCVSSGIFCVWRLDVTVDGIIVDIVLGELVVVDGIFCSPEEVQPEINTNEMHNVMIKIINFDIFIHPLL